jgi:endonuclease III
MSNRAAKYEQLLKSLKKHYKPMPDIGERTVLEHLIYACCLEEARVDQADEAFAKLQQAYFDWNEVRVTTVIELGEALSSLPNPTAAGHRIKRCLQSLFEARYQYDIDDLKKANLGKATDELTSWKGITPFILAYVSQNALGGHSIPADAFALDALQQLEILTEAEAEKKLLPGVERAIPKNKGCEFFSLLHQFSVDFHQHPKSAAALAVFKDFGVSPKAKAKPVEKPAQKPTAKSKASDAKPSKDTSDSVHAPDAASKTKSPAVEATSDSSKKSDKPKVTAPAKPLPKAEPTKADSKKPGAKPLDVKKPEARKPEVKKADTKAAPAKSTDKPASKKPDSKPPTKKPIEPKKAESKKPIAKPEPATKAKSSPSKASPTKGTTKGASKESTNVKMTKKKPR